VGGTTVRGIYANDKWFGSPLETGEGARKSINCSPGGHRGKGMGKAELRSDLFGGGNLEPAGK